MSRCFHRLLFVVFALLASGSAGRSGEVPPELSPEAIAARIQKYRTAELELKIVDFRGEPVSDADVTVEMVSHKFLFGCNAFGLASVAEAELKRLYSARFCGLFNFATLPFYWSDYEPAQGVVAQPKLREMVDWCRQNRLHPKGHALCYHKTEPTWLASKTPAEVDALLMGRIQREVSAFSERIKIIQVLGSRPLDNIVE